MGRVVGDDYYAFVVDVVVRPDRQREGIGAAIVGELERLTANGSSAPRIQLAADEDVVAFYEAQGYNAAPSTLMEKKLGDR